jgi:hypothetical protein
MTLSLTALTTERLYAECCNLFFVMLNVIMLSVVMLSVIMLSVVMLSVIMLSVVMLSVIMLSVFMLSVVAPLFLTLINYERKKFYNICS